MAASGSMGFYQPSRNGNIIKKALTFNLSQLGVECEIDLSRADAHQFIFVALHVAQIPDKLFKEVIGV